MSDEQASRGSAGVPTGGPVFGPNWVRNGSIGSFVKRVQAIRVGPDGEEPQPATALRLLHAFAIGRPIDDLLKAASGPSASGSGAPSEEGRLSYWDSANMLATAALCRSPESAAELAGKQWDVERSDASSQGTPLTDSIVHDVACQRTAPDVAVFVRECRGKGELVDKTLRVFARPSSGRTNLDKALLYLLLRDEGCVVEAATLLQLTLIAIDEHGTTQASDTDPAEFHDLVGALYQLSPAEKILEHWVDVQLEDSDLVEQTRRIVARLIASETDRPRLLVEHVGTRLSRHHVVDICGQLTRVSPEKCEEIRKHAASRPDIGDLAELVTAWYSSALLSRSTKDLLTDIVACGPGSTMQEETEEQKEKRALRRLEVLDGTLGNFLPETGQADCRQLLWIAAAEHVEGWSGTALAQLLGKVARSRDRYRVARTIARKLTARTLVSVSDADFETFVRYLTELRADGRRDGVFLALKELADPSDSMHAPSGSARAVAEIALLLFAAGSDNDGWDLLERYLENEQRIRPEDVLIVVERLRESGVALDEQRRLLLLRATVGRWSDTHARERAVELLQDNGYDDEAEEVVRSLR
ncbi:hypothetical protein DN069_15675 [Streptacidiphilus pinicola]|uniref:Uncharacterized protein n=1 Tax=Streptacidiphilus pinicola TaxID=2219663 RepID=A0A2X0IJ11_9ACTN|nr:hypothetical protein [Streptacidiphilus pinicola]RAG84617.1 hypothetical protein DN069_15675 [Streptacidiphilus pinicola]